MWWMLAREVLRLRGTISREVPWEVMVDLYFYRDPEEAEKEEQAALEAKQSVKEDYQQQQQQQQQQQEQWADGQNEQVRNLFSEELQYTIYILVVSCYADEIVKYIYEIMRDISLIPYFPQQWCNL